MTWFSFTIFFVLVSVISGFKPPYPDYFNYYVIDALDEPTFDMYQYFDDSTFFIEFLKNLILTTLIHLVHSYLLA